jgi:hypothetical protein
MDKLLVVLIVVVLVIVGPLLTMWAWNTLFGSLHTIEYSVRTWLAVAVFGALINGRSK